MATKNKPGQWDCYENAHPDEPMFVLLGRDPMAPLLVRLWADAREAQGESSAKVREARACADNQDAWAKEHLRKVTYPSEQALEDAILKAANQIKERRARSR